MNWRSIGEWLGFQLVWFTSALGAAHGRAAPGVLAAAAFIASVLVLNRTAVKPAGIAIIASGLVGFVAESALASGGLVRFAAPWPNSLLAPAWIVALWLAFGATLPTIASWFGSRLVSKAFVAGAIAGPLAYWAGERLGALEIAGAPALTYLAISLIWAIALPALLKILHLVKP